MVRLPADSTFNLSVTSRSNDWITSSFYGAHWLGTSSAFSDLGYIPPVFRLNLSLFLTASLPVCRAYELEIVPAASSSSNKLLSALDIPIQPPSSKALPAGTFFDSSADNECSNSLPLPEATALPPILIYIFNLSTDPSLHLTPPSPSNPCFS